MRWSYLRPHSASDQQPYQSQDFVHSQVLSRRNWAEIETEVTKGLERIDPAHTALRVEFGTGLAKALLHLKRPAEKVMVVADVCSR